MLDVGCWMLDDKNQSVKIWVLGCLGAWVLEDLIRQAAEAGHSMFVAVCGVSLTYNIFLT
jgi:hypothetical protein